MDQTPAARIAHKSLSVIRRIQNEYALRDRHPNLLHASEKDVEEGIHAAVQHELNLARLEALSIPFAKQDAERRRIAAELAKPYD